MAHFTEIFSQKPHTVFIHGGKRKISTSYMCNISPHPPPPPPPRHQEAELGGGGGGGGEGEGEDPRLTN